MRKLWNSILGTAVLAAFGPGVALAQEAAGGGGDGLVAIGAGIAIGVAAIGPGIGQGFAVASAMESIGRNPNAADRVQTPLIMGLAFMEALAIYGLVIAYFLQSKVG